MKFLSVEFGLTWTLCVLAGTLIGCGSGAPKLEYGEVKGKVSYKGEALKLGSVSFQPASGAPAVGDIQSDGTYTLKAVTGPNTIKIFSEDAPTGPAGPEGESRKKGGTPLPKKYIPDQYGTNGSGLSYTVKAGQNTADFDLK